jgi:hypothetical protein
VPPHLAISLYFEQRAGVRTYHLEAAQTAYISSLGNFVSAEKMPVADTATSRFFLTAVMVDAPMLRPTHRWWLHGWSAVNAGHRQSLA